MVAQGANALSTLGQLSGTYTVLMSTGLTERTKNARFDITAVQNANSMPYVRKDNHAPPTPPHHARPPTRE
mgnify:CR=1 FL=1